MDSHRKSHGGAECSSRADFQFPGSYYVCKARWNYVYDSYGGSAACLFWIAFGGSRKPWNGYSYSRSNDICQDCGSACCLDSGKYSRVRCCCNWLYFSVCSYPWNWQTVIRWSGRCRRIFGTFRKQIRKKIGTKAG